MKSEVFSAIAAIIVSASAAVSQELPDPMTIATESGVCGDFPVLTAAYTESGTIEATCETDATGFAPAAPVVALLGIGLLSASGGGDGTGSTGSTSGTN